jgi:hypothetical protein
VKIKVKGISPKVPPTTYIGQRMKERRCGKVEQIITILPRMMDGNKTEVVNFA